MSDLFPGDPSQVEQPQSEPCPVHGPGGGDQGPIYPRGIQRLSNMGLAYVDANSIVMPTATYKALMVTMVIIDKVIESIMRVAMCMLVAWVLLQLPYGDRITFVLAPIGHPIAIAATVGFLMSLTTGYIPFTALAGRLHFWYKLTMQER